MEENYWNGKGKYQKEYDEYHKIHIPKQGQACNLKAESLRLATNLYYDFYNNGDCNFIQPWGRRLDYEVLKAIMVYNEVADKQLKNLFDRIDERIIEDKDSLPFIKQNRLAFEHLIDKIMEWMKLG